LGDTLYANPLLLGFVWQRGWLPLGYDSLDRAIELNGVAVEKNRLAFEWGRYIAQHGEAAADAFTPQHAKQQAIVVQMPESLDRLIERSVERLSAYQHPRYAARYVEAVERLRAKEVAVVPGSKPRLTAVVARNLAKLMTYKDEYEVARLYADPAYMDKLRAQFEGEPGRDYKLAFHLAPPLLARRDEHGHLKKQRFGHWTLTMFRMLERFRFLRGTPFDVFGKTQERRNERELIEQYFALVDEFCATLDTACFDAAMKLANLPDEIRGFGHVKERNVLAAATKRELWLAEFRADAARLPPVSSSQPFEQAL
jgi:indolepyruvate ferredoxin oxidoreductase